MATIRAFTTIEQSRKLAEILPLESADMHYWKRTWRENDYAIGAGHSKEWQEGFESKGVKYIPCWSLAALLDTLPILDNRSPVISKTFNGKYKVFYHETGILTSDYDNPVDACYNMIIKLYEFNLL